MNEGDEIDYNVFGVDHWNKDINMLILKRLADYSDHDIKSLSSVSTTFRRYLLSQPSLWWRRPKKVNWNIIPLIPIIPQSWYLNFNLIQDRSQYHNYEFVMQDHPTANLHTSFTSTFTLHHFLLFTELIFHSAQSAQSAQSSQSFQSSQSSQSNYSGSEWIILLACYIYVTWRAVRRAGSDVMMTFLYLLCFMMLKISMLDVMLVGFYGGFMDQQIKSRLAWLKVPGLRGAYENLAKMNNLLMLVAVSGFLLHDRSLYWMVWVVGVEWMKGFGSTKGDTLVMSFVLLGFVVVEWFVLLAYWVSYREVMVLESLGFWLRLFIGFSILKILKESIPNRTRESVLSSKGMCFLVGLVTPLYYTCRLFSSAISFRNQ